MAGEVIMLERVLKELQRQTALLEQLANRCDHRWTPPLLGRPSYCRRCQEVW